MIFPSRSNTVTFTRLVTIVEWLRQSFLLQSFLRPTHPVVVVVAIHCLVDEASFRSHHCHWGLVVATPDPFPFLQILQQDPFPFLLQLQFHLLVVSWIASS